MIPRAGQRGHSFKGAGQYFLHDKKAKTKERVMWTHTLNLPTQDPEKAMGWMAHTAMNANRLKRLAGVSNTGRKKTAGDVYTLSLAWHPKQYPDKETLLNAALETVEGLELQEHQAVIVAHNDTEHPHVHIIFNLVHPENGKTRMPSYDWLKLSDWAEGVERNDGEILCEQRVINNQKRKERGQDNKMKLVKHKEKPLDIAPLINELYQQSDSGTAFQAALEGNGYTLAKGDKRGFVLVDEQGKVYSLSRQLKGQRAKDLRERLKDVQGLPMAKKISEERKHFDRDKYEAERQKKIVNAAIEEDLKKQPLKKKPKPSNPRPTPNESDEYLRKLDELRAWEQQSDRKKHRLQKEQKAFYKREELLKAIADLEKQLSQKATLKDQLTNKQKKLETALEELKQNLASIDQRTQEQDDKLEKENQKTKPKQEANPPPEPTPEKDLDAEREDYEQRMKEYRKQKKDKDRDNDLGR